MQTFPLLNNNNNNNNNNNLTNCKKTTVMKCFMSKIKFRNICKANHLSAEFLQKQATHWGRNRWPRIPPASSNGLQTSIVNSIHLNPACLLALVFYYRKENSITMTACLALQVTATTGTLFTFQFLDIFLIKVYNIGNLCNHLKRVSVCMYIYKWSWLSHGCIKNNLINFKIEEGRTDQRNAQINFSLINLLLFKLLLHVSAT